MAEDLSERGGILRARRSADDTFVSYLTCRKPLHVVVLLVCLVNESDMYLDFTATSASTSAVGEIEGLTELGRRWSTVGTTSQIRSEVSIVEMSTG